MSLVVSNHWLQSDRSAPHLKSCARRKWRAKCVREPKRHIMKADLIIMGFEASNYIPVMRWSHWRHRSSFDVLFACLLIRSDGSGLGSERWSATNKPKKPTDTHMNEEFVIPKKWCPKRNRPETPETPETPEATLTRLDQRPLRSLKIF